MNKVLINFAHPARSHSKINNALRRAIEDLDGVTVNDLYANYPDFLIDIEREQALCESNDVIIFQHPFYWYSTPAIIKEWMDLVLEHGWAYGSKAKALEGKLLLQVLSAGGDAHTYQEDGYNKFTIQQLTSPIQATANLCHMRWIPPFTVLGVHRGLPHVQIVSHAEDYRRAVIALRDGNLDLDAVSQYEFLNSDLDAVINRRSV
jgi:glutathione-regulated potassium-efflux system ancillary protein KefG